MEQQIFDNEAWEIIESLAGVDWLADTVTSSTSAEPENEVGVNASPGDSLHGALPVLNRVPQPLAAQQQLNKEDVSNEKQCSSRSARTRSKEVNRRAQKKFRERTKALQAELAELRQTVRRLQSQNKLLTRQNLLAKQQAVDFHPSPCLDWQDIDVVGSDLLGCVMPLWRSGTTLTCTLTSAQTDAICQLSDLSSQQLAIFTQTYTKQMASLLAETGQDMASPSGFQLRSLLDEFSCVHALRARADLLGHKAHIATPSSYSGDACAAARPYPDYQAMVPLLQFTAAQKRRLFANRQIYVTQLARIRKHRQQLLELQSASAAVGISQQEAFKNHVEVNTAIQQLQESLALEHKLYMQYTIACGHGVSRSWQLAVYIVHTFPYFADVVAAVNALAEEAGEPSVSDLAAQAASQEPAHSHAAASIQGEPFEFNKCQLLGNPCIVAVPDAEEPPARSTVAGKATQVVLSTLTEDLTPQTIFQA